MHVIYFPNNFIEEETTNSQIDGFSTVNSQPTDSSSPPKNKEATYKYGYLHQPSEDGKCHSQFLMYTFS